MSQAGKLLFDTKKIGKNLSILKKNDKIVFLSKICHSHYFFLMTIFGN